MFTHRVIPYLKSLADGVIVSRTLKLFGIGESSMEAQLREEMEAMTNPTLAPYAKEGECELRITAKAADEEAARALIAPVEERLRAVRPPHLRRRRTLPGGGGVPASEGKGPHPGLRRELHRRADRQAHDRFVRGIRRVPRRRGKLRHRGEAHRPGGGSGAAGRVRGGERAGGPRHGRGARRVLGCDLAVASTGVAGPDPDERGNPVGLVYLALAAPDGTWVRKIQQGLGRERVRHVSASHGFDLARRYLSGLEVK